jgi:hypothetical protein
MKPRICALGLSLSLVLVACGSPPPEETARQTDGREETRNIRNTGAVGYSGEAIADRVDQTLDASEERNRKLQEADDDTGY